MYAINPAPIANVISAPELAWIEQTNEEAAYAARRRADARREEMRRTLRNVAAHLSRANR